MKQTPFACLLLLCFFINTVTAQEPIKIPKKIYNTKALDSVASPVIDGLLTDAAWDIVEWTGDYIENLPDENTEPIEQTKFKIVYDKEFLYFAFRCYDKDPQGIVKRLSRRDGFEGDWIEINIGSHNDQLSCFSFAASVTGVKSDGFISDNGKMWEGNWNPIWYLKTNIDALGWTAEIKIPLSQLKFSNAENQVWALQSTRRYFRTEERSLWQRVPLDAPGWVSEFGELHGLKGLSPKRPIEVQPYVLSQLETYPPQPGNPFKSGKDFKINAGLDAKIGVTNDLTLNLTINPDFGQVEADPAAIALDGFQIFYQERRPFFVEGKNIFDYTFADDQDNVFYSRRIGRRPQGYPAVGKDDYVSMPENTTILGAAKFSGKTRNGWSIGVLESVTGREFAEVDQNGVRRDELVEPLTNYLIGRVKKDFNARQSTIGGIFTATNRNLENANVDFLHQAAYSWGVDMMHSWKNRKYYLKGSFIGSYVQGSRESITATQRSITHLFQKEGAGHIALDTLKTSLAGTGGKFEIGKSSMGNWRYKGSVLWRSPELELNDIGFLRQADEVRQDASISYLTLKPFGGFRKIETAAEQLAAYDFEGNFNKMQYSLSSAAVMKNNWNFGISAIYKPVNYSNTVLQGGPRLRYSEEFFESVTFTSDYRKKLKFNGGIYHNKAIDHTLSYSELNVGIIYQPVNAFTLSLNPVYSVNKNKLQYISTASYNTMPRYLTADFDQNTLSASFRVDYSINPDLTIQYYGQPFISRGKYKNISKIINPTGGSYESRVMEFSENQISYDRLQNSYSVDENEDGIIDYSLKNPDFSFVQFRSNMVVRWEYIAGSEMFLVWSQGISANGNPADNILTGLEENILKRKPTNIFLLKFTYRFLW